MYFILNPTPLREKYHQAFSPMSPFDADIPLVECSDETIEQIYYYRWHVYCSHIKKCRCDLRPHAYL